MHITLLVLLSIVGYDCSTTVEPTPPKKTDTEIMLSTKAYPEWMCDSIQAWAKEEQATLTDVPDSLAAPDGGAAKDHAFIAKWRQTDDMWDIAMSLERLQNKLNARTGAPYWKMYTGGINPRWIYLTYDFGP